MQQDTNVWKDAVSSYVDGVISKFNEWDERCAEIEEKTHLDNLAKEVEGITKKSAELVTELTKKDGVLDAIGKELQAVKDVTGAYAL
jgi:hypothetical protein